MKVKPKPERFQETDKRFDIIITFEERVMDIVVEGKSTLLIQPPFLYLTFSVRFSAELKRPRLR